MLFRLESDLARADVSVQGGELQAWYIGGENLLGNAILNGGISPPRSCFRLSAGPTRDVSM